MTVLGELLLLEILRQIDKENDYFKRDKAARQGDKQQTRMGTYKTRSHIHRPEQLDSRFGLR